MPRSPLCHSHVPRVEGRAGCCAGCQAGSCALMVSLTRAPAVRTSTVSISYVRTRGPDTGTEAQGYGGRYRGDWLQSKGRVGGRLPGGSGPTGEIWRMSRSYPGEEGGSSITARESSTCKGLKEKGQGESLCTGGGELPGSGWKAPQGWAVQDTASRVKDSCLYPTESGIFNTPAPAV